MTTQHRPRVTAMVANATCQAAINQGRATMKAMRDLNRKLDKWKIADRMTELATLEATYNKFRPFSTDHSESFLHLISTGR